MKQITPMSIITEVRDSRFVEDLEPESNKHRNYNLGMYNLAISIRDLRMYKHGIKPYRNWKITDLKKYIGIKGNKATMLEKLETLHQLLYRDEK